MTEQERAEKLRQARAKHGRPFCTEVRVKRQTEPSWKLKEIMSKAPKQTKVTTIKRESR